MASPTRWIVERDKVVIGIERVPLHEIGRYRWRWMAMVVAWVYAHGWWGCYVREATSEEPPRTLAEARSEANRVLADQLFPESKDPDHPQYEDACLTRQVWLEDHAPYPRLMA